MRSAPADSLASAALAPAPAPHVAVVVADASCSEAAGSLLTSAVVRRTGTLAIRDIDELSRVHPAVVVLVANSTEPSAMAALRRIRRECPSAPLVVIARDDSRAGAARQAVNAGADAFVRAEEVGRALGPALDAVMAGLVCVPRAARRLIAKPTFSHREKQVLGLLVAGLTNRQIAARLYLAESTVKTHLASAFAKLGVRSRKDAAALLLDPAEGLATTALPADATLDAG